ncbi:Peptidoglycan D,D-transpeptidase MrdA [Thalassocella blandensis]|nr:Peptidoglycan D,D-transpeptidase MrdA [Thalassocella blandensis]
MNWASTEHHRFKDHVNEANTFTRRVALALLLVFILFCILIYRFYSLQVVHYENYVTLSDRNRIQVRPVPPNRGLIYDRNGELLAENRPSFTLSLVKERVRDMDGTIARLSELVDISESDKENFFKYLKQRRRPFEPVALRYRLDEEEMARLAVNKFDLKGVEVNAELVRYYPKGELYAHIVGYVGRINESELNSFDEETDKLYRGTHSIGKIGLEKHYESQLLGTVGVEYIETNAHGRALRTIDEVEPQAGQDLHLHIDSVMQQAGADALAGRRGAMVAIDIATGGVLAMVSTPSFDPNLFVTGISVKNYRALNESRNLPLFNRTIQGQYPPGSTLKPVLGLGGLEAQIISTDTRIRDPGFYQLENDDRQYREWKKGGHGSTVGLHEAIVESCDIFFYDLAFRMGVDRMHEFGTHFGLGEKTDIDIPSERAGIWPSRQWKRAARGQAWYPGNSLNMSIGQGDVLATPLQLAVMTATLARRGTRMQPSLVASIGDKTIEPKVVDQMQASEVNWEFVKQSMSDVVNNIHGTAHSLGRLLDYKIAGKTGTAQVVGIAQGEEYESEALAEFHRDHTLFVAFGPVKNPTLALAVIVENGEKHGDTDFPVVKAVFDAYFAQEKVRQANMQAQPAVQEAQQ